MRNACTVTVCLARHVFRAVVPVSDVSRVLADMFVACGRMAVYSQQPTKCWAPKSSWCISSMVASQTDCQQVEPCSLQGTAPIFLALWVAYDPLGQTMEASNSQSVANICKVCWCMRNACTVTVCLARHVFRAVVPVSDVSRVLADMFVACGRMAVYSQQPTKCWAPKSSWCISSMVASQTDCQQVEPCSLQGTAPIFLALWVAYDPLGQTMEASNSQSVANICKVCWCMRNACTVTVCLARHVFRAVVPVSDVSRVLADMFVACGRMAVYSQQPTKCWAPKSSWCISSMVASQTDCQQVEPCSLQGTAPIFLALWVAYDPLGQTMEASNSQSVANICKVCWCMRNACTVTACHARHVFRAVVHVSDVSRVLADMFVACGRMAVYSQQPTKCWAPKSSWCISSMVASQTDCQQVESCFFQGTTPTYSGPCQHVVPGGIWESIHF